MAFAALAPAAAATGRHGYPRCFGAASRDPAIACRNPALARVVIPPLSEAQVTPNSPCERTDARLNVCLFGAAAPRAQGSLALIGDSHAETWRAAVAVAAAGLRLQGVSISRSSCPFTAARSLLPPPRNVECARWVAGVVRWLARHPELRTVLLANHSAPVATRPHESLLAAQIDGFTRIFAELPASVTQVVAIRDNPYVRGRTLLCVQRAQRERRAAGSDCALARATALHPDPAALAARRLHAPRFGVIDLTRAFCDLRRCYPVIGGALAYKDATHLTRVFATTLGPQLEVALERLLEARSPAARTQRPRAPPATTR